MGLRKRVEQIAADTAKKVAANYAEIRMQQLQQDTTMQKITKTNSNGTLTVRNADGSTGTVTNVGDRYVGVGDFMIGIPGGLAF